MTRAFVGIGANVGDPVARVRDAVAALGALPDTQLLAASALYRTAPLGYTAQADFVNAAVLLDTALAPRALLDHLQRIEAAAGRERSFPNAPRTLDLDLLLYGGETIAEPGLAVPHPRLHERAFALAPVVELDPDCVIPGRGSARACLARVAPAQEIERL